MSLQKNKVKNAAEKILGKRANAPSTIKNVVKFDMPVMLKVAFCL